MEVIDGLLKAAREYDRPGTERTAEALIEEARRAGQPLDRRPLRDALTQLRDNRWFDLLRDTTERIMEAGDKRPFVRRLYAQALIDTRAIDAAIPFLEQLVRDCRADAGEYDDARGLLGRAWKQAYVNGDYRNAEEARKLLRTSAEWYWIPYRDAVNKNDTLYHGINTVAVLARAERDGVSLGDGFPDWRALARELTAAVTDLEDRQKAMDWDLATAAEACVALAKDDPAQWRNALSWLKSYVYREGSAFAIMGTLRQLREVWGLSRTTEGGAPLVLLLEAEMLAKKGGQSLDASGARDVIRTLDREADMLQAVLGTERYHSLESLRMAMIRSCAVGKISKPFAVRGTGSGFLVRAGDIDENLDGQLFITNHHVVPAIVPLSKAVVTFEALDSGATKHAVKEQVWTSATADLDVTVLRLKDQVEGVEPFPLCDCVPDLDAEEKPRVYIIGHPLGGTLSFSISDNLLIDYVDPKVHYRTPTEEGSSGSPVFDESWSLLAVHRKGGKEIPKLRDKETTYAANEGHFFRTIRQRFRERPV
jgi:hypothetical protein